MIYTVTCPDPDCNHEFKIEKTVEQLANEADLTACPECLSKWESDYDEDADTLELIDQDDYDDEEDGQFADEDDEDEDE